jgi:hypothetical protein
MTKTKEEILKECTTTYNGTEDLAFEEALDIMFMAMDSYASQQTAELQSRLERVEILLNEVYYSPGMTISDETFNRIENYILTK